MKKITISEIAKKAGVSKTVVSAILNKKENEKVFVSERKKKEILGLIEKYGYVPRKSARALASQRTNTIGLIFHHLTSYFSFLLEALQQEAFRKGLEVIPYLTEGYTEKEEEYLNLMRDGRVDGVITAAFVKGSPERYLKFSSPPYNLKILTISPAIKNIPSVHFDKEEAGRLAAEHLLEIGCKNLCFFGGDETFGRAVGKNKRFGRAKGFIDYLKEKGLPSPLVLIGKSPGGYFEEGKELSRKFFRLKNLPDGVFAFNDMFAIALLSELLKRGIKVPQDIAIMGCDNTELCLYTHPTLTSIDTSVSSMAKIALEKIVEAINGRKIEPLHTKVPLKLVRRDSTKRIDF